MTFVRIPFALFVLTLFAGCVSQQGVSNVTDAFSYGGQAAGKDGTQSYTWQNTQGKATVSWGGQASSGSFTLTILDAAGKQVYTGAMGTGQNGFGGNTASGTAGAWTIRLEFRSFTGQMRLSVVASGGGMYTAPNYPTYAPPSP